MNYLVPIDFSEASKNAAAYAASLTGIWPGSLHLLHVITPIEEESSHLTVKTLNAKKNTVFEMFQFQEQIRRTHGVRSGSEMTPGAFASAVMKTARKEKSDIVVLGAQGAGGLREYLFGSNIMDLISETTMPLLAIPDGVSFKPFGHVVYLTQFDPNELDNIAALGKIASKFKALLSVLSVNSDVPMSDRHSFRTLIREKIPFAALNFEDRVSPEGSAEALLDFTLTQSVDLLGLPVSDESLPKITGRSLTDDFVFAADVPILFFPS